ncbi:MAG: OB-fold nucleic acid binding domain-containing protein, partial [Litorilinea sp.]
VILAARDEGGPFHSLEDFCDRVDLRAVNKRSLECLIKVGAFDRFGTRNQLLAVMEQLISHSAGVHNARDSGQLSMFDLMGASGSPEVTPIRLPAVSEESGRERLQWEKELLGVYAMSHPMNLLNVDLQKIVTCACNELDARYDGKHVMLAGMIAGVRAITTKKGDPMAFVQLEDLAGQCEVVVFPRTYAEVREILLPDSVVVVKGVAQTREGQTSLLADSFQTHVDQILTADEEFKKYQQPLIEDGPTFNGRMAGLGAEDAPGLDMDGFDIDALEADALETDMMAEDLMPSEESSEETVAEAPTGFTPGLDSDKKMEQRDRVDESANTAGNRAGKNGTAPTQAAATQAAEVDAPLPAEPPGWLDDDDGYTPYGGAPAGRAAPAPDQTSTQPKTVADAPEDYAAPEGSAPAESVVAEPVIEESTPAESGVEVSAIEESGVTGSAPVADAPDVPVPANGTHPHAEDAAGSNGHGNGNSHGHDNDNDNGRDKNGDVTNGARSNGPNGARTLEIQFRSCGDIERDKYRLRQIYDAVRDPKGRDHFMIVLQAGRKLAFPHDPCSITERLVDELSKYFRVEARIT